jgi:hypothetical protein
MAFSLNTLCRTPTKTVIFNSSLLGNSNEQMVSIDSSGFARTLRSVD